MKGRAVAKATATAADDYRDNGLLMVAGILAGGNTGRTKLEKGSKSVSESESEENEVY